MKHFFGLAVDLLSYGCFVELAQHVGLFWSKDISTSRRILVL